MRLHRPFDHLGAAAALLASLAAAGGAWAQSIDPLAPLPTTPAVPAPQPRAIVTPQPPIPAPQPRLPSPQPPIPTPQLAVPPPRQMMFPAPSPMSGFEGYKFILADRARRGGVSEATIAAVIPSLGLNARVIQLDRSQPGGPPSRFNPPPPFAPYRRAHVTSDLIQRGSAVYRGNYQWLRWIEARYGVEPSVLIAIFGHETSYGRVTGSFDLPQALASLAYEGRRRRFFEDEFVATLRLIDSGVPRWRLKGSWAGATGYPQFMPSAVLRLGADGDGDGRSDIWSSQSDALASIANYLRSAGWQPNLHWGVPVRVPAGLDRAALRSRLAPPRCPQVHARHSRWLTMREWRAFGLVPLGRWLGEGQLATLIEPDGIGATGYLLTVNYRAILDYNCSNFYALAVGVLADSIRAD